MVQKFKKSDKAVKKDSFLNEFQLEGKGSGKIALENWEEAMGSVNRIITNETRAQYRQVDWNNHKPVPMAIYCHDCHAIVPPDIKTFGKKTREVCGICGSKKISKGREEALRRYYRLDDPEEENTKSTPKDENKPSKKSK